MNGVKAMCDCGQRFWSSTSAVPLGGVSGATKRLPDTLNRHLVQQLTGVSGVWWRKKRKKKLVSHCTGIVGLKNRGKAEGSHEILSPNWLISRRKSLWCAWVRVRVSCGVRCVHLLQDMQPQ